jgi:Protein of unknown function (DUF3551)
MRLLLALVVGVFVASAIDEARADQYRWCAIMSGGDDGGASYNCYFVTLQQCQWAVSGVGGFCIPSQFSNDRPAAAPAQVQRKKKST